MFGFSKKNIQKIFNRAGFRIIKLKKDSLVEEDEFFQEVYAQCKEYTMTSRERAFALCQATKYIVKAGIPGDFVECGVWRGGSAMIIASTLAKLQSQDRKIYLYDTFSGMTQPSEEDFDLFKKKKAEEKWQKEQRAEHNQWDFASLEEVKKNMQLTEYPQEKLVFVKGKVEETIPKTIPAEIALLRLDTDWHASTKHELEELFPVLKKGGVLIVDDYGHWAGSKKAVDEYFSDKNIFLSRVDYAGIVGVKTE